jgi:hypothetical protein
MRNGTEILLLSIISSFSEVSHLHIEKYLFLSKKKKRKKKAAGFSFVKAFAYSFFLLAFFLRDILLAIYTAPALYGSIFYELSYIPKKKRLIME